MDDQETSIRTAAALCSAGRLTEARHVLEALVATAPVAVDAWVLLGKIALTERRTQAAGESIARALTLRPRHPEALYALGRIRHAAGDPAAAVACFQQAVEAGAASPDVYSSLGIALRKLDRVDEAIAAYRSALAIRPDDAGAKWNLANALAARAGADEAHQLRLASGAAFQAELGGLTERATALFEAGRHEEALDCFRKAMRIRPTDTALLKSAADFASWAGFEHLALTYYEEAVRLDPTLFEAVETARAQCTAKGLAERAAKYAALAYRLRPADEGLLAQRLILPAIQQSNDAIRQTRADFEGAVDEFLRTPPQVHDLDRLDGLTGFFLAYHSACNRDLQIKVARMYLRAMPSLATATSGGDLPPRRPGRIRVGFVSAFMYRHSIGHTTRGLVEQISRAEFETYVLHIGRQRTDEVARAISAAADHALVLEGGLDGMRAQIAALHLDILFYQDVGMDTQTYFLALSRLAPVQCVSFGHPDTTGIPNMDYFVSNNLFETADAPSHYSERLFLLHDLPTLAYYHRPPRPAAIPDRHSLGLPADANVYLCAQMLQKFHPDFDLALAGILRRDPKGCLVLVNPAFDEWMEALRRRFATTLAGLESRIHVVPSMARERFVGLMALADVSLDTWYFNGMNSTLESFSVGTPVVTYPSALQRGRHTLGMYTSMGITDCIASDGDEYVDIAVRIGTDKDYAHALRQRILAQSGVLFENQRVVREFERFFRTAHEEAVAGGTRPQPALAP